MNRLLSYWHSLSSQDQTTVIIGVIVTVVGGIILAALGTLSKIGHAAFKRLFGKSSATLPQPQPITIKLETPQPMQSSQVSPQPLAETKKPTPTPDIPRPTAVQFVPRRDRDGRDILTQLKAQLAPQSYQLVVLWGPGGVGKTRLASEAAYGLKDGFGNRVVWVSADGLKNFGLTTLLDGIATQLDRIDLRPLPPDPKKELVRELIASAPPLIVLDNFETIAPDEQTRCTAFLAQEASCPALITTRWMIASNYAHNISIDAMSEDEARKFLEELIAQAPDREPFTETNRQRIIQESTANPLVMQWIVQQIVLTQEPQSVLDNLSHGEGDAAERVFDNSFELPYLGADGRAALLALSLFSPSASRPSLAEVAGFGDDAERLNLAAKSLGALRLVKSTESGKRLLIEGLTRELAKARLSKDEHSEEFRRRFVAHFLGYAQAHTQPTPADYDALEAEKDSVLSAMDVAFNQKEWASVMQLMDAISFDGVNGYIRVRGYWDEVIRRGEQALKAARNLLNESQIARFSHNLAITYQWRGELAAARRLYDESLQLKKQLGNQSGIANTLHQLAMLAQEQGDLGEARRLYDESLQINKQLGNQSGIAITLHQLAMLAQDQGDLGEARRLYEESLLIKKQLGNQRGIAITLHQLAMLAQDQGDLGEARRLYDESLQIAKQLGDQSGIASTLNQLGNLAENKGNNEEAAQLFAEALAIFERLKSPNAEIARGSLERVKGESA